jgi:hypothetical protein
LQSPTSSGIRTLLRATISPSELERVLVEPATGEAWAGLFPLWAESLGDLVRLFRDYTRRNRIDAVIASPGALTESGAMVLLPFLVRCVDAQARVGVPSVRNEWGHYMARAEITDSVLDHAEAELLGSSGAGLRPHLIDLLAHRLLVRSATPEGASEVARLGPRIVRIAAGRQSREVTVMYAVLSALGAAYPHFEPTLFDAALRVPGERWDARPVAARNAAAFASFPDAIQGPRLRLLMALGSLLVDEHLVANEALDRASQAVLLARYGSLDAGRWLARRDWIVERLLDYPAGVAGLSDSLDKVPSSLRESVARRRLEQLLGADPVEPRTGVAQVYRLLGDEAGEKLVRHASDEVSMIVVANLVPGHVRTLAAIAALPRREQRELLLDRSYSWSQQHPEWLIEHVLPAFLGDRSKAVRERAADLLRAHSRGRSAPVSIYGSGSPSTVCAALRDAPRVCDAAVDAVLGREDRHLLLIDLASRKDLSIGSYAKLVRDSRCGAPEWAALAHSIPSDMDGAAPLLTELRDRKQPLVMAALAPRAEWASAASRAEFLRHADVGVRAALATHPGLLWEEFRTLVRDPDARVRVALVSSPAWDRHSTRLFRSD